MGDLQEVKAPSTTLKVGRQLYLLLLNHSVVPHLYSLIHFNMDLIVPSRIHRFSKVSIVFFIVFMVPAGKITNPWLKCIYYHEMLEAIAILYFRNFDRTDDFERSHDSSSVNCVIAFYQLDIDFICKLIIAMMHL